MAVFKNKLSDAMQEASETQCWLEFAKACNYIKDSDFQRMDQTSEKIIGKLIAMDRKADKFCY